MRNTSSTPPANYHSCCHVHLTPFHLPKTCGSHYFWEPHSIDLSGSMFLLLLLTPASCSITGTFQFIKKAQAMESSFFSVALLILLFNFSTLCFCAPIFNISTDQHALLSFKNSIIFSSDTGATLRSNWSEESSVCEWIGVSCGIKHHRVTALNLSRFHLAGNLSPYLGNLTFLRYLDISYNNFIGVVPFQLTNLQRLKVMDAGVNLFIGEIPTWLGDLPQLEQLILRNNSFSGGIPPSLFNNSKLQTLDMTFNSLTGGLPSDICNDITNLKSLSLSFNQLSGKIPSNIWKCKHLEILSLSANHFSGNIPSEIGSLGMVRLLYLGINDFRGSLPTEIGNLSRLEILSIRSSSLIGTIPLAIFNLSSLMQLDLGNNSLSGGIPTLLNLPNLQALDVRENMLTGELPQEIGTLPRLQLFIVPGNSLSGSIPSFILNLSTLTILDLSDNSLSGSIPTSIFNLSTLNVLDLTFNQFLGSLPLDMGYSLPNLEWLLLGRNRLNGPIPTSITNASKLAVLDMGYNMFNGFIPNFGNLRFLRILSITNNNLRGAESPTRELIFLSSLTNCRHLEMLDASENPLNGILPVSIGNFSNSLLYFSLVKSNIKGVIPSGIGTLSSLLQLKMDANQMIGSIPPTIGKLTRLQRLYLGYNELEGSIPSSICQLSNLGELGLQSNKLVGEMPECLGKVKSLREIYLNSNQLNSTIPSKLWSLRDLVVLRLSSNYFNGQLSSQLGYLKALYYLDLSSNQFSGDIPSTVEGCQSLEFLSLSNNKFSGVIPESLGNVKSLTTLDLSNNSLSGLLPKSLAKIQSLSDFNVSYNRLEGEIPNEGCFANFTAQSFANNSALCGSTRFQVPPCSKNQRGSSFVKLMKYIVPSLVLVVVLVVISILMLTRRNNQKKVSAPPTNILQGIEWRRISYIELERGTSSFSEDNLLGKGGFSSVFQATLSDGLKVAAKVFDLQLERAAQNFDNESELLSNFRHRNIVHVIGCCSNLEFKALILEYMPNGSLEKWLYSDNHYLDLMQRVKIAIDVASALEYLHHGYTFPVVHCDIKPSNVLLDEDMTARVGDFGISKLFENGEEVIQTKTLATIGYAAPEYGSEGKVSTKGDVYSYGILLLEMFTSKKPTNDMFGGDLGLKEWVNEALQEHAISEVVEDGLLTREDGHFSAKEQCVLSIFSLAMKCISISPNERINMIEAVATLQKIYATFVTRITRHQRYAIPR